MLDPSSAQSPDSTAGASRWRARLGAASNWWCTWRSVVGLYAALLTIPAAFLISRELRRLQHPPSPWSNTVTLVLAVESIIFGVYGLLAAFYQRRDAFKRWIEHQTRMNTVKNQLTDLVTETRELQEQASTRFIGEFPKHISEIIEVFEKAGGNLSLMADCVDYGSFVEPAAYKRLYGVIEKALEKRQRVRILVCGKPAAITQSSKLRDLDWESLKKTDEYRFYFGVKYRRIPEPCNQNQFDRFLSERQQHDARELCGIGVDIRRLRNELDRTDLFLWLAEGAEAVFCLTGPGNETRGLAFRTRDSKLIEVMKAIFDGKWEEAGRSGPNCDSTDTLLFGETRPTPVDQPDLDEGPKLQPVTAAPLAQSDLDR